MIKDFLFIVWVNRTEDMFLRTNIFTATFKLNFQEEKDLFLLNYIIKINKMEQKFLS